MEYRSCSHDDIDDLAELWSRCGLGGDAAVDRAEITERLREDDGFFLVGVDNAGAMRASVMGCYDNHRGWVKRFAVDPSLQRTGVGSALLAELEARFVAADITKLRLAVWGDNDAGAAFWTASGFEELTAIRYFVKTLGTD